MKATDTRRTRDGKTLLAVGPRRARHQRCSQGTCTEAPEYLCDFIMARGSVGIATLRTCDEPICKRHAIDAGGGRHYCQGHPGAKTKLEL